MNIKIYPKHPKFSNRKNSTTNKIISIGYYTLLKDVLENVYRPHKPEHYHRWILLCNSRYSIREIELRFIEGTRITYDHDWQRDYGIEWKKQ